MKKAVIIILIMILTLQQFTYAAEKDFMDIKGHWAEWDIKVAVEKGIVDGLPDGTYNPNGRITRAQFIKMLVAALKLELVEGSSFDDMTGNWAGKYVETALMEGIISISDIGNSFRPEENLKRSDMALMIARAIKLRPSGSRNPFIDIFRPDGIITKLDEIGIVKGTTIGGKRYFRPLDSSTRAEAAVIINRMLQYKDSILSNNENVIVPLMEDDFFVIKNYSDYLNSLKYALGSEPKVLRFRFYMTSEEYDQQKYDLGNNFKSLGWNVGYSGQLTYGYSSRYFEAVYNIDDYYKILTEADKNVTYDDEEYGYLYDLAKKSLDTFKHVPVDRKIRYNKDDLYRILDDVRMENGGLVYTNSTGSTSYYSNGYIHEIGFYFEEDVEKISRMRVEAEAKADAILKIIIGDEMTPLQKEKAIHDYLVTHTKYDSENYEEGTVPDESYTPYGVLVKGTGVCSGYARAAALLLYKAGIECMLQDGYTNTIGAHEWNKVKIDGVWYHLDVTFDDPVPDGGEEISYEYFNISDEQIRKDHSWE